MAVVEKPVVIGLEVVRIDIGQMAFGSDALHDFKIALDSDDPCALASFQVWSIAGDQLLPRLGKPEQHWRRAILDNGTNQQIQIALEAVRRRALGAFKRLSRRYACQVERHGGKNRGVLVPVLGIELPGRPAAPCENVPVSFPAIGRVPCARKWL